VVGKETGIPWTDSTYNSWWGCTKVGPACDHCYAESTDNRAGGGHWGPGADRRLLSENARNEPLRWHRNADKFFAEHGRKRRVFTLSMGDLFDNEVPEEWRRGHMEIMEKTSNLEWQICTKRISNLPKMVPIEWRYPHIARNLSGREDAGWPRHVGVLVTIVTQAEANRDLPRLLAMKKQFDIPWVGVSWEPAQEPIDFMEWVDGTNYGAALDWIIFGGKSGQKWNDRPFSVDWARPVMEQCSWGGCAFFFKQVAAAQPKEHMIPKELFVRQWPVGH
jgi:protein gp37